MFGDDSYTEHDQLLRWFDPTHLPIPLKSVMEEYRKLAVFIVKNQPASAERTVALRKLIESKDAAIRGKVDMMRPDPNEGTESE